MYYSAIKDCDIANGVGVRVTLFVSGCTNRCEGCFNPETWNFCHGQEFTDETKEEIFSLLGHDYINGLTLLGGEPFEPQNQRDLLPFLREFKEKFPDKTLWAFTGFYYETELLVDGSHPRCEATDEILGMVDVLVEGRFILAQKDISLVYRGSSNQRIIDMIRTREKGEVVLWDEKLATS
ncbi:MAG: anaerobic ribonucleoside-triphosphate reductase activating protein [Saccharofermentans sp.]|nr:anaerobic ribonucleoside-triphosphate reductase activating protein [Saccharofermentans sp.]